MSPRKKSPKVPKSPWQVRLSLRMPTMLEGDEEWLERTFKAEGLEGCLSLLRGAMEDLKDIDVQRKEHALKKAEYAEAESKAEAERILKEQQAAGVKPETTVERR